MYINAECNEETAVSLQDELTSAFVGTIGFALAFRGCFTMKQDREEKDELKIQFFPKSERICFP